MSDVPTLEVSLQEKRQRDYNPQLDMDMRKWVAAFLGVDVDLSPSTSFASIFKDGILLCRIINKIKPGTIPEPARTGLAFKQMENIQNYLHGCKELGLPESSLFNTIDLFEEKNVNMVIKNVYNMSQIASGVRPGSMRDASSSAAAAKQRGLATSMSSPNLKTSSGSLVIGRSPPPPPPASSKPTPAQAQAQPSTTSQPAPPARPARSGSVRPPVPPRSTILKAAPVVSVTSTPVSSMAEKRISRRMSFGRSQAQQMIAAAAAVVTRGPDVSSLTDDINAKAAFKYNPLLEEQASRWVCGVLGVMLDPSRTFISSIKDGVLLCKLINKLKPGTIPQIHTSSIAYKQMENIAAYLKACVQLGLSAYDCFNTVDLYEEKDINVVINNIHVLAKHVKAQGIGGEGVPAIEDSKRARRPYSIFLTEVQGLQELQASLADLPADPVESELVEWMNSHISKDGGPLISNTHSDLKDGVALIRLLEVLSDVRVGHYVVDPKLPWHRIQNATLILRFIAEQTFWSVRGCTSHDIVLGNAEPLKTLLKHIRSKFDRDFLFQGMEKGTRRQKIAEELTTTERTYVTHLRTLTNGLLNELKSHLGQATEVLTADEIEEVFANVEEIVEFHSSLLDIVEARLASYTALTEFGDLFVEKFDETFVTMYKRYVRDFDSTHLVIKFLEGAKPEFRVHIDKFENEEKSRSGLLLNSFLILPVQRVPRYMLLLQELEKQTPEEHPDSPNIKKSIEILGNILDDINASKTKSDSQHKLSTIESSIAGLEALPIDTLVHPKRRYVREGVLTWRGESEDNPSPYFFLFNDFLMYTTRRGNEEGPDEGGKAFEYITIVPLNFITLVEECEAEPNAFQVALEEELTLFVAPSPKERDEWIKDLQQALDEKVVIQFCEF